MQTIVAPEIMCAGPSETGKTFACLWRLDHMLRTTPKAQAALIRKVRSTIAPSVLRTFLRVITWSNSGAVAYGGNSPIWYAYPNGARLWIAGMDDASKVLSSERDWIYVNQAEELTQDDWETLSTRTTGRGAVTATPMVFGDCNPGPADHWIQRRKQSGALVLLESRHEDNPSLYDAMGALTEQGARSMAALDRLTGVRKQRLRYGRWVGAEGEYYTQLDGDRHIVPMPQYAGWEVWAALDYGFSHPLSFGVYVRDPYDHVYCIGQHSAHKWYIPQHATAMDSLLDQLGIDKQGLTIVAGHDCWNAGKDDPETIADKFAKHGYRLERAIISRVLGARALGERLGNPDCDPPILPSLFFVEQARPIFDCLTRMVHDPKNAEDVLKVNADTDGRGGDDCFVAGTRILTARGEVPIEQIVMGDMVLTRGGYRPVKAVWNSRRNADVVTATLSNGTTLTATPNHRIWTPKIGWKCIDTLRYGDIMDSCQNNHLKLRSSSSTEYPSDVTPCLATQTIVSITRLVASISNRVWATCMLRYGSQYTESFLMDTISTIETAIHSIMTLTTSNALVPMSTLSFTAPMGVYALPLHLKTLESEKGSLLALLTGIARRKDGLGTEKTLNMFVQRASQFDLLVSSVVTHLNRLIPVLRDSALTNARQNGDGMPELITSKSYARNAESHFPVVSTAKCNTVHVYVLDIADGGKADTYALHVADHHEYYANGILVKNCYDQIRYAVMHAPMNPPQMTPNPLQGASAPQLVYVPGKGIRTAP